MEWKFNKLTKNETIRNPSHLEFFHDEALQSVVDAFVREDIQNRLDAKAPNEQYVRLDYSLCGPKPAKSFSKWFKNLNQHLSPKGTTEELGYTPQIDSSITWLVAEDYNTTGLYGDPDCYQDPPSEQTPRNDFYWFIRNVGRSGKSGAERGRWGLGKIVYPAASKIRSFFAYSVQHGSLRNLLIGRSVLAIHQLDGAQHDSDGYFGDYLDKDAEFFATPNEDIATIDSFREQFNIRRKTDEPGLTIAIPFPDPDITFSGLIASIVKHWFMILIEGRLNVTVRIQDEEVIINNDTLEAIVETYVATEVQQKRLLRQIKFARVVQNFDQNGDYFYSLIPPAHGKAPNWNQIEERFGTTEQLEAAREAYRTGKPIGLEVPIHVIREDGSVNATPSFEIFIQRTEDPIPPTEAFLRDGMAILGIGRLRESGVLAIIRAENNELGSLLGDAENPAHTRWERSGKHFRNKYKYGPSILSFVKQSAERVATFLTTSDEGQDKELLRSLFYLPETGEEKATKKKKRGGKKTTEDKIKINAKKPYLSIRQRNDGFIIEPHAESKRCPERIVIRAAYNVDRGNPFKAHHPADFDFTKKRGIIGMELRGMEVEQLAPNRVVCKITDQDFEFSAEGFDKNRDLVINVRPEATEEAEPTPSALTPPSNDS
ncbi:MAG: hypothetical protein ACSHYA_18135 [Opitutaceae bacterium]